MTPSRVTLAGDRAYVSGYVLVVEKCRRDDCCGDYHCWYENEDGGHGGYINYADLPQHDLDLIDAAREAAKAGGPVHDAHGKEEGDGTRGRA